MVHVYRAHVHQGVVVADNATLPEGAAVTITLDDEAMHDGGVQLSPEELAELEDAIAEGEESDLLTTEQVFAQLDAITAAHQQRRLG